MMTTMAALLGGLPLALGTGTGSELRRPLGITIVGGLIVSQALTLFTTPVVYLFFDRLADACAGCADKRDAGTASREPATGAAGCGRLRLQGRKPVTINVRTCGLRVNDCVLMLACAGISRVVVFAGFKGNSEDGVYFARQPMGTTGRR